MEAPSGSAIPVEAILKLIVDRSGEESVKKVLQDQDTAFSKVEQTVGRIGTQMEGVTRLVAGLAGVGGVGALVDKFVQVESSASNVALAMGKVTGGMGSYHGIGQEMLGVQAKTGVSVSEQEGALRALAMSVGLNPKPGQTGMLAEVIAGYSKSTGMPASVLGSILGPMLQAEGRTSSPSAVAYTMGEARANLGAFPGSQIESVLPGIGALTTRTGFGAAASGHKANVGDISALVNDLANMNPLFHGEAGTEAASGIVSGIENAESNPTAMILARAAGFNYMETQEAANHPAKMEGMVKALMGMVPGKANEGARYRIYKQIFGGSKGALAATEIERRLEKGETGLVRAVAPARGGLPPVGLQAETTPESELSRLAGAVEQFAFANPIQAGAAGAGAIVGAGALSDLAVPLATVLAPVTALGLAGGKLAKPAEHATASFLEALFPLLPKSLAKGGGGIVGSGLKDIHRGFDQLFDPEKTPQLKWQSQSNVNEMAKSAMQQAEQKFGPGFWHNDKGGAESNAFINKLFKERGLGTIGGAGGEALSKASGEVNETIKDQREYSEKGAQGYYTEKFGSAVEKFAKAVGTGAGTKTASYGGGGAMHDASLTGAAGVASLQSTVPGMVMASFLKKGATPGTAPSSSGPGTIPASYSPGSTSSAWNAVLQKYSGSSYGLSHVDQLAGENPGGGAHPGDRATVEADAKKYGIPFDVLWGVYGAESSFGKAKSNFGLTGQFPGTGTSGNFNTDARMAAEDLHNLVVNVNVGGHKVEQHKVKIGAGSQLS